MRTYLAACAMLLSPAFASAQASFTSQDRSVEATSRSDLWLWEQGTNPGPPDFDPETAIYTTNHADQDQAPDFGPFSATASSTAPPAVGPAVPAASSSASQTSSLSPGEITASGSFSAVGDAELVSQPILAALNALLLPPIPYFVGMLGGVETGTTHSSVDFQVGVPTPYHLVASVTLSEGDIGQVPHARFGFGRIELTGASGSVALLDSPVGCGCTQNLDTQGVLAPGSYTLEAELAGGTSVHCNLIGCGDAVMNGSFEMSLSLASTEVPGPTLPLAALLAVALAATGAAALRARVPGRGPP